MHSRNQSLDILRCIAILLVLGHHFIHYHHWAKVGWIGVDLFFVLSGFLISGLLFSEYKRNGQIDIQRFILRRGLKIWPAYYVLVIVTAIISMLVAHARGVPFPSHEVAVSAIFVRNFFGNDGFNYLAHSWSLAVEEHFYLMLPLLLLVLLRLRRLGDPFRSIPWIFLAIAPTCLTLRYLAPQTPYPWATHLRIDALFAGVFIGYLYHFCRHWFDKLTGRHALPLCALCVAPAFVFPAESWPMRTYGLSLLMIGFTFLVAWSVAREPRGFIARFAAKIGFYSYSIYLWHPCLAFPFGALFRDSTLAFWIALPLAIAIGVTMSELVEIPVLRFRERWGFTKAKTETAIPSPVSNSAARDVVFLPAEPSLLS